MNTGYHEDGIYTLQAKYRPIVLEVIDFYYNNSRVVIAFKKQTNKELSLLTRTGWISVEQAHDIITAIKVYVSSLKESNFYDVQKLKDLDEIIEDLYKFVNLNQNSTLADDDF